MPNSILKSSFFILIYSCISMTGLYSQGESCSNPIIVCDVVALDGLGETSTISLPQEGIIGDQPKNVCGGNGTTNNPVWYSFIAGATTISLSVFPSNCTDVPNGNSTVSSGIQGAIFDACGFPDNTYTLDCHSDGVIFPSSLDLTSSDFKIGHTYYLLLDGWNASVCDYYIKVTEGLEEYNLPNIDAIIYDNTVCDPYPICAGAKVDFTLDGFGFGLNTGIDSTLEVYYNWEISPFTTSYPTGIHSVHDTSSVEFVFDDAGLYSISCTAYTVGPNGGHCDTSNTASVDITILGSGSIDEVFDTIWVCQGRFPVNGPTIEDPNGDGIVGWLGGQIMGPGLTTHEVVTPCGCSYEQSIEVIQIDLAPRLNIDTTICDPSSGPHVIGGVLITQDIDTSMNLIATNGCDSLISLKVTFIDLSGDLEIEGCTDSVTISHNNLLVKPLVFDEIIYRWEDDSGSEIKDLNVDDTSLKVINAGKYHLFITLKVGNSVCEKDMGSIDVDFLNISPSVPIPSNWPLSLCPGTDLVSFGLANGVAGLNYNWTFPIDVVLVDGQGTPSLKLDWSGNTTGGFVTVTSSSLCGSSDIFQQEILIEQLPAVSIDLTDSICIEDITSLTYTGDTGHSYNYLWDFFTANVSNTGSNDEGPYNMSWSTEGKKFIALQLSNGPCTTEIVKDSIVIIAKKNAPNLTCSSEAGKLIISWEVNNAVSSYVVNVLSGTAGKIVGESYEVEGLGNGDMVEIEVYGVTSDLCGETQIKTIKCVYESCPVIALMLSADNYDFCNNAKDSVLLNIVISGDTSGNGLWSGDGVVGSYFYPSKVNAGEHYVYFTYSLDDCEYIDSLMMEVIPEPTIWYEEIAPACWDEVGGRLIIHNTSDQILNYIVNGSSMTSDTIYSIAGAYTVTIMDSYDCGYSHAGSIDTPVAPSVTIKGVDKIRLGGDVDLTLDMDIDMSRVDSIVWMSNNISLCTDCVSINMVQDVTELEYCVTVYYDADCSASICKKVIATDFVGIYFPTIFGTDMDGQFSSFNIDIGHRVAELKSIIIYDHWGGQLYKAKNISVSGREILWDGYYKGELVQPGVYVFAYELVFPDGKKVVDVGDVTVIR